MPAAFTGCLFIPEYPAWALARATGEPLVAVISSGRVIARNARLRRLGLELGMFAERARSLVANVFIRQRDKAVEEVVWDDVLHQANALTPFLESVEPGRLYFRLDRPDELKGIAQTLGVQGGVASCRSHAFLASLKAVPGNVIEVRPHQARGFFEQTGVGILEGAGVSGDTIETLRLLGYANLALLSSLSQKHLGAQFGEEGGVIYTLVHPTIPEPPITAYTSPAVIQASHHFEDPVAEPRDLLPVLKHLIGEAQPRLGTYYCRRVRLSLVMWGSSTLTSCRILPEAVAYPGRLLQTAQTLLIDLLRDGQEIVTLSIELGALCIPAHQQQALFRERPTTHDAARAVHRKYPGACLKPRYNLHEVLPERRVWFEPFPEAPRAVRLPSSVRTHEIQTRVH